MLEYSVQGFEQESLSPKSALKEDELKTSQETINLLDTDYSPNELDNWLISSK